MPSVPGFERTISTSRSSSGSVSKAGKSAQAAKSVGPQYTSDKATLSTHTTAKHHGIKPLVAFGGYVAQPEENVFRAIQKFIKPNNK